MDATHSHPVQVSAAVLEGLDAVWLSGETNTMDAREVAGMLHVYVRSVAEGLASLGIAGLAVGS